MREFKVKISNELHSALQHIAQARGQTVTALVKRAIRQELGNEKIEESGNAAKPNHRNEPQRDRVLDPCVTGRQRVRNDGPQDAGDGSGGR